jgi:Mg2+-importing ATPase
LLLNFLTDFPAITISSDNTDSEDVAKPRGWRIAEIRRFMIVFGLLSSVFDILSFLLMTLVFKTSPEVFRSGWFIESSFTELAVMLTLRTRRRFWKSIPSMGLLGSSVAVAIVIIGIPYTSLGGLLQLVPVPLNLLAGLGLLTGCYIVLNEVVKKHFFQRANAG